jgi:hypothetical protein
VRGCGAPCLVHSASAQHTACTSHTTPANTAGSIYPEPSALQPGQAVQRRARPGSQASHPAVGTGPRPDSEQIAAHASGLRPAGGSRE